MDAPVIGAEANPYPAPGAVSGTLSWRYQKSFRHFVGREEQVDREEEGSQVVNRIHIADVALKYAATPRTSVTVSFPYLMAERSSPIRDQDDVVIARTVTEARGLGDVMVTARRWMLDPESHSNGNFSLGLGVKLPTGANNVIDARQSFDDTDSSIVTDIRVVDQSIQPGDGGFGVLFDLQSFQRIAGGRAAFYLSGSYLANPEGTNGVLTFRSRATEAVMSVADQYIARAGGAVVIPWVEGLAAMLGGRFEGVAVDDLVGPSDGFRRPGYVISVEPGLSYSAGRTGVSVAVPIAVERNRRRSVPDMAETGRHGDAAFADYLVIASYAYRFER